MSTEVEPRKEQPQFVALINRYANVLTRVAPPHLDPEQFIGLALAYVGRSPKLIRAAQHNPESLIYALREAASLGHAVGKDSFVLVPFNNQKATGGVEVVGIEHWKGLVDRMLRSGGVRSVHAMVIRERDPFVWNGREDTIPHHAYDWRLPRDQRGHLIGVYAYAHLVTGGTVVRVLNVEDVARYRAFSASGESFWGPPWPGEGPNTPDMWKKTAMHRLEGLVPATAAYRWEVARAEQVAYEPLSAPLPAVGGGGVPPIEDAEILDEPGSQGADGWPETARPGEGVPGVDRDT